MNRKQKIIVSITGITLVLLILVGLTYAYFLTRIQGNTNNKSIDVTTKDLALVYRDGTPEILFAEKIIPDNEHSIGTKEFNVTNTGNAATDYMVVIDNIVVKDLSTNPASDSSFESFDFTYTLTCTQYDVTTDLVSGTCTSVTDETALPDTDDSLLISNNIDAGKRQEYVLTVYYKDTGINQSDDMNKSLEAIVDIRDIKSINPYASISLFGDESNDSLAYNIINNSLTKKNGTELRNVPLTKPAEEVSTSSEKELSVTPDDDGTSYYYRGVVTDNYVDFAGYCWRIVRIEGDGAVKLILSSNVKNNDSSVNSCANLTSDSAFIDEGHYGYTSEKVANSLGQLTSKEVVKADYLNGTTDSSNSMKTKLTTWYSNISSQENKLKNDTWCIGDTTKGYNSSTGALFDSTVNDLMYNNTSFYYKALKRLFGIGESRNATLKCDDVTFTSYIGTITADEVAYAGGKLFDSNNYYLLDNANKSYWLTLSIANYASFSGSDSDFDGADYPFVIEDNILDYCDPAGTTYYGIRPAITLVSGTTISDGEGTQSNPYVIN